MYGLKHLKKTDRQKQNSERKIIEALEKKAFSIVIELIDHELEEDVLLNKLCSINVGHYKDVVEERFILKKCGYVICRQHLTHIPTQQYKISLSQKKVYDITERKKFCSNMCYKCSKYLQSQLLSSPLWLRDTQVIPRFQLLKTEFKEPSSSNRNENDKKFDVDLSDEKFQEKISQLKIND